MNERTTLEKIAPTIEEAIADGLTELGLKSEQVDIEILDSGSRGLFGVGVRQARVRITVKEEKPSVSKAPVEKKKKSQEKPAKKVEAEAGSEITEEALRSLDDNLLFISRQTVADILEKMGVKAKVEVRLGDPDEEGQRPVCVDIHGNDLALLIGRREETLNALQAISS